MLVLKNNHVISINQNKDIYSIMSFDLKLESVRVNNDEVVISDCKNNVYLLSIVESKLVKNDKIGLVEKILFMESVGDYLVVITQQKQLLDIQVFRKENGNKLKNIQKVNVQVQSDVIGIDLEKDELIIYCQDQYMTHQLNQLKV